MPTCPYALVQHVQGVEFLHMLADKYPLAAMHIDMCGGFICPRWELHKIPGVANGEQGFAIEELTNSMIGEFPIMPSLE